MTTLRSWPEVAVSLAAGADSSAWLGRAARRSLDTARDHRPTSSGCRTASPTPRATSRRCAAATRRWPSQLADASSTMPATKRSTSRSSCARTSRSRAPSTPTCAIASTTSAAARAAATADPPPPRPPPSTPTAQPARRRDRSRRERRTRSRRHRVRRPAADRSAPGPRRSKIGSRRRRWSICATAIACSFPPVVVRGVVSSVNKAGRLERKGSLTLAFDQVTINGRDYPIRATVTQALESEGIRVRPAKIGAGAGVGAIIGGILGGFKGALAGILIGGGGNDRGDRRQGRRAAGRDRAARAARFAARSALMALRFSSADLWSVSRHGLS